MTGQKKSQASQAVELIGGQERTAMALFHEGNRVDAVHVGDTWTSAKEVFPEPPRGSYEIHDLPSQFGDKFEAQGWETNRDEGFGVILMDSKVVSAVYELEHQKSDVIDGYIREEIEGLRKLKPKQIIGGPVVYWFWHDKNQTTMICKTQAKDGVNLTLAVGDDNVLKQLKISEEDAKSQIAELSTTS